MGKSYGKNIEQIRYRCRKNRNFTKMKWNRENLTKVSLTERRKKLKKNFGLTLDEYNTLALAQNNLCYICGKPETHINGVSKRIQPLSIDHCHITNKIRKLLCNRCNVTLGRIENSQVEDKFFQYIHEHREKEEAPVGWC